VVRNINPADWFASPERKEELRRLAAEAKEKEKQKRVQASRLGKILADQTTRRVIVGVLSMMIATPFLEYQDTDLGPRFGLQLLYLTRTSCTAAGFPMSTECEAPGTQSPNFNQKAWEFLVYEYSQQSREYEGLTDVVSPMLWLHAPDFRQGGEMADIHAVATQRCSKHVSTFPYSMPTDPSGAASNECEEGYCCWRDLPYCTQLGSPEGCPWRSSEMEDYVYTPPECEKFSSDCFGLQLKAKFLTRWQSEYSAYQSGVTTTFIIFLLGLGSVSFSRDTQSLVVAPIEKMVNIVKQLADDPLRKPYMLEAEQEMDYDVPKKPTGQLETSMLETTILKIGGLLRVGFGEAGAQIIGGNMASQDGELNIMVTGRKVVAIYAFCRVTDFIDMTECLMEEVMVFVNKIAKIVHSCSHEWKGTANKNIGDAFLCIWMLTDGEDQKMILKDGIECVPAMQELVDRSLLALVKIVAECRRASDLAAYAKHPEILPKFGMTFRVNLSFGLNVGWSIEGAIGSEHKIDASYLSSHVNIAARLEAVTKVYGCELLLSEFLFAHLGQKGKDRCRLIDKAKLKHNAAPLGIYCFDINRDVVPMAPDQHQIASIIPPPEMTHAELLSRGLDGYWGMDQDVVQLQEGVTPLMMTTWAQAYRYYSLGTWSTCIDILRNFSNSYPAFDGPTQALLTYMSMYDNVAPSDWDGYRTVRMR
jgi:class 3 adenylate cyclase